MKVTNWGLYPAVDAEVRTVDAAREISEKVADWENWIARGLGRCYGDSALNPRILSTLQLNRFLSFDSERGVLRCQAGVSLAEVLEVMVPMGWFPPVTPGTKFVTIGGMVASDVHGKNHHCDGSFSRYVEELVLLPPTGQVMVCSPSQNSEVFWATCGGMGLTGMILEVSFRMKSVETAFIREEGIKAKNLDAVMKAFEDAKDFTYSVAWLDCLAKGKSLGRSILLNGEHARVSDLKKAKHKAAPLELPAKRKLAVPFFFPGFVMNGFSIGLANKVFYGKAPKGKHVHIKDYDVYYYPLDGIHHWNRVYGRRGFVQYQFVLPPETGYDYLVKILERISKRGFGSFLTVLKWFGQGDPGLLSFPKPGLTLALDFPRTKALMKFLDELDALVLEAGGRLYLTKDSRMKPEVFQAGYPELERFKAIKRQLDPNGVLQSLQSQRLGI